MNRLKGISKRKQKKQQKGALIGCEGMSPGEIEQGILDCCEGRRETFGGYKWAYATDKEYEDFKDKDNPKTSITE